MKTEIVRYQLKTSYPFSKWKVGEFFYPTQEELEEINKFKYYFENVTVQYKIIRRQNDKIVWVERLSDGELFKIGDTVSYTTTWNPKPETITFVISNFAEYLNNDIITACQDKNDNEFYKMCGIGLLTKIQK